MTLLTVLLTLFTPMAEIIKVIYLSVSIAFLYIVVRKLNARLNPTLMTSSTERASDRSIAARETQIGSNLIDRLARLGLHHLDSNIFRQYVGPVDARWFTKFRRRLVLRIRHRVPSFAAFIVAQSAKSLRNVLIAGRGRERNIGIIT